jgi:glycosyltransferase involved in cell wall biosynthesis
VAYGSGFDGKAMRIGIDATGLGGPKTGTAVYLAEILAAWSCDKSLNHEFIVFATPQARAHLVGLEDDSRFTFIDAPSHRHWRVLWQQTVLPLQLMTRRVHVHWGTGFVLPLLGTCPMVVTVHDLTFQMYPQLHERIKRIYFPAMIQASVAKARQVLTISQATKADLHRLIPASRCKTKVTLLAARDLGFITDAMVNKDKIDNFCHPYVLFVGTFEPRKNLARLLEAWQGLSADTRGVTRLVLLGATGWLMNESMDHLRADDSVVLAGQVTDEALGQWMSRAQAFLYPSLYEGFGLPVIEAMAQGIPVLTSNIGATREVAGSAALLVDPTSVESIRDGLARLLSEPELCEYFRRAGRQRAASFSWSDTAQQTLQTLREVGDHRE